SETAAIRRDQPDEIDSRYSWARLVVSVLAATVTGVGMWSIMVVLPAVQAEFGVARADATLPFTLAMMGFAGGGVVMGRLADRHGVLMPIALGGASLVVGYVAAGLSQSLWQYAAAHLLIGIGVSSAFGPLIA